MSEITVSFLAPFQRSNESLSESTSPIDLGTCFGTVDALTQAVNESRHVEVSNVFGRDESQETRRLYWVEEH